jgi:predicted nucleotidyltransferase
LIGLVPSGAEADIDDARRDIPTDPWSRGTVQPGRNVMTAALRHVRQQLTELCRKHRVKRLDAFGSATRADFDERSSDVDLLIEFEDMSPGDRADAFLGFLTAAEALLGRRVDLLERNAVLNPYLREQIEASRELVYAA